MTETPNPATGALRNLAVAARGIWRLIAALLLIVALMVGAVVMLDQPVGHRFLVSQLHRLRLDNGISFSVGRVEGSLFSDLRVHDLRLTDAKGVFLDVKVLSHHEPVFLEGLGEAPLFRFVDQYKGLALQQSIKIGSNQNRGGRVGSANVYIDGVSKATASVRIINQSLLSASLAIARAKLGFADLRTFKENLREQSLKAFHHKAEGHLNEAPEAAAKRLGALLATGGWKVKLQERDTPAGKGWMLAAKAGAANKIGYIAAHSAIVLVCVGACSMAI